MKSLVFTLALLLLGSNLFAQRYVGVSESQYAGYSGTFINPANFANPNSKVDIGLFNFNIEVVSDLDFDIITSNDSLILSLNQSNNNYANVGLDFEVNWIGGLISINKKMGIGFGIKSRAMVSARGLNKDLLQMSFSGLEDSTYFGKSFSDQYLSLTFASWNEYSLSFASEVFNTGVHTIRAGGTVKLLQSNGSFYLHANDLSYTFQNADTIASASGDFSYGGNFNGIPAGLAQVAIPFAGSSSSPNFGFGLDFGAMYEYKPEGSENYKLKAGLSFHDVGFITATPDSLVTNSIRLDDQSIDVNYFDGIQSFDGINQLIANDTSQFTQSVQQDFLHMQLPTKMNIFVDYNVVKGFYVSFFSSIGLYTQANGHKLVGVNSFELTPRYDFKWVGFSLPITYTEHGGFGLGLGLRLGPVFAGTSNLIGFGSAGSLASGSVNALALNGYFGFRIPLYRKSE